MATKKGPTYGHKKSGPSRSHGDSVKLAHQHAEAMKKPKRSKRA